MKKLLKSIANDPNAAQELCVNRWIAVLWSRWL